MAQAEFDSVADEYDAQHRANIAITGEDPAFFSEYKIAALRGIAADYGVSVGRILDFGSGIGNSIPFFRQYFPEARLTCTDTSARSLEMSRERFPEGSEEYALVEGDAVPAPDATADLAFSACVFHHIPHEEHVHWLRELRRATRPGGLVSIFEHNPLNPLTVRAVNTCPFDANAKLIRARQLKHRLEEAGWREVSLRYHVFFPHALAALRPLEARLAWFPLGAQYSASARRP
ncbi:Ubiquinone/menaquinone biosynthesis C-methylase UbiE [Roseomonas rosea]|jgi:SAM-dependent methyltransferase|uniref:Ubiquinone/menaquinone biosynthesis C-methylase UbiE n=1 Tax=Muricoccus roseus TaxID=198092 RepID=A0A1M6PM70_9PROT|nr:class I SAM-dependent methyltransferase [Roseomonas rosea]SHK09054.1 Ubiquinone/menaquinone biosynthesis C-methylase UbiE [Roseomonas rosea]